MKNKNRQIGRALVLAFLFFIFADAVSGKANVGEESQLNLFSFAELTELYEQAYLAPLLEKKLNRLLTTPFVDNSQRAGVPVLSKSEPLGEFLRVAQWNIERGLEYEAIEAAFTSEERFAAILNDSDFPPGSRKRAEILRQASLLSAADVIILNEVDWGMKRTGYRNVVADLARSLHMNYAFGVQFVELSPVYLSNQRKIGEKNEAELAKLIEVDPELYKGLHGVAILSRFPLENVRLMPFKNQPYDWFESEKKSVSMVEKGKRELSSRIFLQETLREVRRGGRTSLLADIADPRLPGGRVTIAATHLENRTKPSNRLLQLNELLGTIKDISHPVILAGDMNTSTSDLTPTTLRRELMKRFGNPKFWIKTGVNYMFGFGLLQDFVLSGVTFGRVQSDPTVRDIPFIAPNPERKFFHALEAFRFSDGGGFDFRGDSSRSNGGKSKRLSNSNERGRKGFLTTYQVTRPIFFVGKYKLDWIFVKPPSPKTGADSRPSYRFAPHFGRTLTAINEAVENRISDHRPLLVDLPLGEPVLPEMK